jgi:hypothetical protein
LADRPEELAKWIVAGQPVKFSRAQPKAPQPWRDWGIASAIAKEEEVTA